MIGWLTACAIILVAGGIVWLARLYSRLSHREEKVENTREILQKIGAGLGIERYEERNLFGSRVHRLRGHFNDLEVDLEVQVGRRASYMRLHVGFPHALGHDLRAISPRQLGLWKWAMRLSQREFETDDGTEVELMTRSTERLEQLLNKSVLFQVGRLLDKIDDLRIGEESMFLMCTGIPEPDRMRSILTKALEVGERLHTTARQIGPSTSQVGASVYEDGATGMFQRVDGDSTTSQDGSEPASTSGRFAVDTSSNPALGQDKRG